MKVGDLVKFKDIAHHPAIGIVIELGAGWHRPQNIGHVQVKWINGQHAGQIMHYYPTTLEVIKVDKK